MANRVRYQNVLRAIGQGLEDLEVESFELENSDGHWEVAGECEKPNACHAPESIGAKTILSFIGTLGRKKTPTQNTRSRRFHFFGLRFTPADVDLLDRQGKAWRANSNDCTLNPSSISQALRTAGADLDHRANRLLKLGWHQQTLTIWYLNALGVEAKKLLTPPDLYNLWVHQFKQRSKPTGAN